MTATLAEPEPAHVCVYRGMFGIGWTCCYGVILSWDECPIRAVNAALEAAHAGGGNDG